MLPNQSPNEYPISRLCQYLRRQYPVTLSMIPVLLVCVGLRVYLEVTEPEFPPPQFQTQDDAPMQILPAVPIQDAAEKISNPMQPRWNCSACHQSPPMKREPAAGEPLNTVASILLPADAPVPQRQNELIAAIGL